MSTVIKATGEQRSRLVTLAGVLASLLVSLALWQALAWLLASEVLPGPWTVAGALVQELGHGLEDHILVSAYRVALAILIAATTAVPLGLFLGMSRRAYAVSAPLIYLTYPIPKIVLLPVFLLFLGLGDAPKVAMIALILFFQVLILVRDDVREVRPELVLSVRSLGASPWDLLRHVYLPASLPGLFSALRVSVGVAIAVLFFVESFGTRSGLGYYILVESWGRLAYPQMYAGVVAMALLGLTFYFLLDGLESRVCRWARVGR
ncbi:MAG: ABC transporter permease [Chloroflexi bacterium]|nr:ABC transporter permease [Chloroflexota bacterium]